MGMLSHSTLGAAYPSAKDVAGASDEHGREPGEPSTRRTRRSLLLVTITKKSLFLPISVARTTFFCRVSNDSLQSALVNHYWLNLISPDFLR
jgi:hypothetical protein